ncbi:MAG TPA: lipid A deacylase LpxR family protein [Longimicrobium sp.]|jgi:hypothetical protein|uniref:lipid A deacylase LpxR family protein n=1 Tax=Longimicrobium sp. TaxID=2029185 RepID=UPI002ED85979
MRASTRVAVTARTVFGLGLVLACAVPLGAQAVTAFNLRLDNDILALRGHGAPPDYDYTHGLHVHAELSRNPGPLVPLQTCAADGDALPCLRTRLHAGQEIYTPRRDAPTPLAGERPYAAWLYAGTEATVEEPGRQRALAVQVGIVGPAALGEPVQNGVHRLNGSEPQVGWAHQLGTEPGLLVRYRDERVFDADLARLGSAQLRPGWMVVLGNVHTAAQAGASARVGAADGCGPFLLLGGSHEWVVRDLFLDGNTFRGNSTARKLPFVATGEVGAGYGFGRWSIEYRFVARGRQYHAQPRPHAYGSLGIQVNRR